MSRVAEIVATCGCRSAYTLESFRELGRCLFQGSGLPGVMIESRQCPRRPDGSPCGSHCSIHIDERGGFLSDAEVAAIEKEFDDAVNRAVSCTRCGAPERAGLVDGAGVCEACADAPARPASREEAVAVLAARPYVENEIGRRLLAGTASEPDAQCSVCDTMYYSAEGHPELALCRSCWTPGGAR